MAAANRGFQAIEVCLVRSSIENECFSIIQYAGIADLHTIHAMQSTGSAVSASSIALLGLLTLATAMGIGRFAFTPLLPLMQKEYGVTLAQGAWLATANYVGYFVGAAVSFALVPKPGAAVRYALVIVAVTTAAMAVAESHWLWIGLRFAAGVASAFALIGASAWMLNRLSTLGRSDMSGWVFSGVGVGIVLAGGVALVTARFPHAATTAWLLLGGSAALVAVLGWPRLTDAGMVPQATRVDDGSRPLRSAEWWLIVCYGAFGFGYIIPATFIPAMASKIVDNPWMFGWAWPFFGAAAAASTVVVTRHFQNTPPRTVATWSLLIMAVGVLLPAITRSIAMIIAASLCVGGTFMVMTIAGFQEARRLSSAPPARLIAAMTAAFAIGQLIGPMLVGIGSQGDAVAVPSFVACAVLIASAIALRYGPRR